MKNNFMDYNKNQIKEMMEKIELDITEFCNLSCTACTRSCVLAPNKNHMTLEQIKKFIRDSIKINKKWKSIRLIGGEPLLHPFITRVFDIIKKYKNYHSDCYVDIMTNGGQAVQKILPKIPSWIKIFNNRENKEKKNQNHYVPFNVAPIDVNEFNINNMRQCIAPFDCGIGLTKLGYFPCVLGGGIARVFNLQLGIKRLENVNFRNLNKIFPSLCRVCGWYLVAEERYKKYDINMISQSWREALRKYNRNNYEDNRS